MILGPIGFPSDVQPIGFPGEPAAPPPVEYDLTANWGNAFITGQDADLTLIRAALLTANWGNAFITGEDATLTLTRVTLLTANWGNAFITGQDAGLTLTRTALLTANWGNAFITGQQAELTLERAALLTASPGSVAVQGSQAELELTRVYQLQANPGLVRVEGAAADLALTRAALLTANWGQVVITGQSAELTLTRAALLTANWGQVVITGQSADLDLTRLGDLTAEPGAISITGQDADLILTRVGDLTAQPGPVTITGGDADLQLTRVGDLEAQPGAVQVTGHAATLTVSLGFQLTAEPGRVAVNGSDAILARALSDIPGAIGFPPATTSVVLPFVTLAPGANPAGAIGFAKEPLFEEECIPKLAPITKLPLIAPSGLPAFYCCDTTPVWEFCWVGDGTGCLENVVSLRVTIGGFLAHSEECVWYDGKRQTLIYQPAINQTYVLDYVEDLFPGPGRRYRIRFYDPELGGCLPPGPGPQIGTFRNYGGLAFDCEGDVLCETTEHLSALEAEIRCDGDDMTILLVGATGSCFPGWPTPNPDCVGYAPDVGCGLLRFPWRDGCAGIIPTCINPYYYPGTAGFSDDATYSYELLFS